eukprot:9471456-Pyramimonas_sp.AAC.3
MGGSDSQTSACLSKARPPGTPQGPWGSVKACVEGLLAGRPAPSRRREGPWAPEPKKGTSSWRAQRLRPQFLRIY